MALKKLFTRKKKNKNDRLYEDPELEEGFESTESEEIDNTTTFLYFVKSFLASLRSRFKGGSSTKRYIHIPYYRKAKRALAGIYMVLFTIAGIMFLNIMTLFFLGVSFIMFDYLLKTRGYE